MKKNGRQPRKEKGSKEPAPKTMGKEEFLEFALSAAEKEQKLSHAARVNLRANYEVQYDYPNEYIAFLDDWSGKGRNRRLDRRIVAHSTDMKTVSDAIAKLSHEDRCRIQFLYVDDPFTDVFEL